MSTQSYKPEITPQGKDLTNTSKGRTLIERAATTKLLYNYLEYVSPSDVDGIKKAYVTVGDKGIKAKPVSKNSKHIADMYGKKPTLVAEEIEPMALIDKSSSKDIATYRGYGRDLVRSALRRIVDEV
jgi:hypothetical protein